MKLLAVDWNQFLQMIVAVFGVAGLIVGTFWVFFSSRSGSRREIEKLKNDLEKTQEMCQEYRDKLIEMKADRDSEVKELQDDIRFIKRIVGKMVNRRIDNSSF